MQVIEVIVLIAPNWFPLRPQTLDYLMLCAQGEPTEGVKNRVTSQMKRQLIGPRVS